MTGDAKAKVEAYSKSVSRFNEEVRKRFIHGGAAKKELTEDIVKALKDKVDKLHKQAEAIWTDVSKSCSAAPPPPATKT